MELLLDFLVIIVAARLFGEIATRVKLPSVVGEVTAGAVLGVIVLLWPGELPVVEHVTENPLFESFVDLGIFFLMLMAGMEVRLSNLVDGMRKGVPVALGGVMLPILAGVVLGFYFLPSSELLAPQIFFLGVAMAITALPITVSMLSDLRLLESRLGGIIVDASILDDIIGIVLLATLISMINNGVVPSLPEISLLLAKVASFFVLSVALAVVLLPLVDKALNRMNAPEMPFTIILLFGALLVVLSESLGMHFMIGAFVAGLLVRDRIKKSEKTRNKVEEKIKGVTMGLLAPIFFASTGLHMDLTSIQQAPVFTAVIIVVAIASKLLGCGVPALLMGMPMRESMAIGFSMSARGGVELIIASVALQAELFNMPQPVPAVVTALYSAVIIMAVISSIIAPASLRLLLGDASSLQDDDPAPVEGS